ncbi:MAG TPA: hypothetical protein VGL46_18645 [Pseudonocardiaceae bacterium]|jgi:hypothetical protein
MSESAPETIPLAHQLRVNAWGTARAEWVLGSDQDGIGFVVDGTLRATTVIPGDDVAQWAGEQLEVVGVRFVGTGTLHVWAIEVTS